MKFLLKKFDEAIEKIKEQEESSPEALSADEQKRYNAVIAGIYNIKTIIEQTLEEERTSGQPMSKERAELICQLYDDFKKPIEEQFEVLDGDGILYISGVLEPIITGMREEFNLLNQYMDKIREAAKPDAEPETLQDIVDVPFWIEDLIKEDPNAENNRQPATEHWDIAQHSIQENLEKYREDMIGVHNSFYQHVKDVTGVDEAPINALEHKLGMIADYLNEYYPEGQKITFGGNISEHKLVVKTLNPTKIEALDSDHMVSNSFFDKTIGKMMDETVFTGLIEGSRTKPSPVPKKAVSIVEGAYHKLRFKPYNMGIDSNTLERMDNISKLLLFPNTLRSNIKLIQNKDPINVPNHPLQNAMRKVKILEDKMKEYMISGDASKLPTPEDFSIAYDYLGNYVETASFYENDKGEENLYVNICYGACKNLAEMFPAELGLRFEGTKQHAANRVNEEFQRQYEKLCTCSTERVNGQLPIENTWNAIKTLYVSGHVSTEDYEKAYFIRVARDAEFRDAEMATLKRAIKNVSQLGNGAIVFGVRSRDVYDGHLRTTDDQLKEAVRRYLICKQVSLEYDAAVEYSNSQRSAMDAMIHPYESRLGACLTAIPLEPDQIHEAEQYRNEFLNNPSVVQLKDMSAAEMTNLIEGPDAPFRRAFYGSEFNFTTTIDEETLQALTQPTGRNGRKNSDTYTSVCDSLKEVARSSHKPGGTTPEDYIELFNSLSTYLHTHDSKAFTDMGKLRFNSVAKVMADIGPMMMEKLPDMKPQIEKEMKLEMLRSKSFRDRCIENASKTITSIVGESGMIDKLNYDKLPADRKAQLDSALKIFAYGRFAEQMISKDNKNAMITGKCDTPKKQDELLTKYDAISKYADKAISNSFNEIMVSHGQMREERNPQLGQGNEFAKVEKEGRLDMLSKMKQVCKAKIAEAYASKNDAELLDKLTMESYLNIIEENAPAMSAEALKAHMETDMASGMQQIKPLVAHIIENMPASMLEIQAENGALAKYVNERLPQLAADKELITREYENNLAKNNGVFARTQGPKANQNEPVNPGLI